MQYLLYRKNNLKETIFLNIHVEIKSEKLLKSASSVKCTDSLCQVDRWILPRVPSGSTSCGPPFRHLSGGTNYR